MTLSDEERVTIQSWAKGLPHEKYTNGMLQCHLRAYLLERAKIQRRRAYSVHEIAEGARLSQSTVQSLLAGRSRRIDFETVNRLCRYLECRPGDWLVWVEGEGAGS